MKLGHLNNEEKLDLIINTFLVEVIEKTQEDYRVKIKYENPIKNLENKINNVINLENISDFFIEKSRLTLMTEGCDYYQEAKIEMLLPQMTDAVYYKVSLFYEPNVELISEILANYRSTSVVEEE